MVAAERERLVRELGSQELRAEGRPQQAAQAGKPLRLRMQVKSFDVVARLVQSGLGIGVLPEDAADAFAKPMGLRLIHLTDAWARRRMFVCVKQYASLPPAARLLVDSLVPSKPGSPA